MNQVPTLTLWATSSLKINKQPVSVRTDFGSCPVSGALKLGGDTASPYPIIPHPIAASCL